MEYSPRTDGCCLDRSCQGGTPFEDRLATVCENFRGSQDGGELEKRPAGGPAGAEKLLPQHTYLQTMSTLIIVRYVNGGAGNLAPRGVGVDKQPKWGGVGCFSHRFEFPVKF